MKNKKVILLILVMLVVLTLVSILVVQKLKKDEIVVNNNENVNQDLNQNIDKNVNVNSREINDKGELIQEADHWKKYVNKDWGVEFRLQDLEDKIVIYNSSSENQIVLTNHSGNGFILNKLDISNIYNSNISLSNNLSKYFNTVDYYQQYNIISNKEIINSNNLTWLVINSQFIYRGPDPSAEQPVVNDITYFINNSKDCINEECNNTKYISLNGNYDIIISQILDSFKFID